MELLLRVGFKARNGTGILIIAPTRELALQIYGVARELTQFHALTHGIVIGGANRKAEVERLQKGVNLLVGTPGRLLDHMQSTPAFLYSHLAALVIDEADRILEVGFEQELKAIISRLPTERQTMLFSATQTQSVKDVARLSLRANPLYVSTSSDSAISTVQGVEQGYVVCESRHRFLLLFTFLKKTARKKKVIVFFSTCAATQFYSELLNYIDLPVLELHGQQKQTKRTATFFEFVNAQTGALLCTDVAARGLDIPSVDWIIQFDPPEEPKEYIHRVGRTARGEGSKGKALLFLLPSELLFLKYLKAARVPLSEYEFPLSRLSPIQQQLESLISKNYYLHKSAREAYRSYVQAYAQHQLRQCFDVHQLDVLSVAKSFGFEVPPKVQLSQQTTDAAVLLSPLPVCSLSLAVCDCCAEISLKKKGTGAGERKSRHGFAEDAPYGTQEEKQSNDESGQETANPSSAPRRGGRPGGKSRQWSR